MCTHCKQECKPVSDWSESTWFAWWFSAKSSEREQSPTIWLCHSWLAMGKRQGISVWCYQAWRMVVVVLSEGKCWTFKRPNLVSLWYWIVLYWTNKPAAVCRISVKHKTTLTWMSKPKNVCPNLYLLPNNLKAARKDVSWKQDVIIDRLLIFV